MRKRYVLLIAILLLAFAAGLAWQLSQPREPMYEGRPLSYWLEGYNFDSRTETSEQSADLAMREIGTNAIPTLLRMLQESDSPLKVKFFALVERQSLIKVRHVTAVERNYSAFKGFESLGASARVAVPVLIQIYGRNNSDETRIFTACSLGAIGPAAKAAVPILLSGLMATNPAVRFNAVLALGKIHSDAEMVLPYLTNALSDTNRSVRAFAFEALGDFGADAKPTVPLLIKFLNDPDPHLRKYALSALKQIDPQAATNLPTNLQPVDLQARP